MCDGLVVCVHRRRLRLQLQASPPELSPRKSSARPTSLLAGGPASDLAPPCSPAVATLRPIMHQSTPLAGRDSLPGMMMHQGSFPGVTSPVVAVAAGRHSVDTPVTGQRTPTTHRLTPGDAATDHQRAPPAAARVFSPTCGEGFYDNDGDTPISATLANFRNEHRQSAEPTTTTFAFKRPPQAAAPSADDAAVSRDGFATSTEDINNAPHFELDDFDFDYDLAEDAPPGISRVNQPAASVAPQVHENNEAEDWIALANEDDDMIEDYETCPLRSVLKSPAARRGTNVLMPPLDNTKWAHHYKHHNNNIMYI